MPQLFTLYTVQCDECFKVVDGKPQKMCFLAHWSHPSTDSPSTRKEVLHAIAEQTGIDPKTIKKVEFSISGLVPERLLSSNRVSIGKALPAGRVKYVIEFQLSDYGQTALFNDLEEKLHDRLVESGAGFVDGNEIGQGTYRIFCHGPKKVPLMLALGSELEKFQIKPVSIRKD